MLVQDREPQFPHRKAPTASPIGRDNTGNIRGEYFFAHRAAGCPTGRHGTSAPPLVYLIISGEVTPAKPPWVAEMSTNPLISKDFA